MVTELRKTMMRGATTFALTLLTLIGSLFTLAVNAPAQSLLPPTIQAQPPTVNVSATRSASVSVTWVIPNTNPDPILSINSTGAQLFFAGPNGSGSLPIAKPLIHGPLDPGQTARIRDTMVIPQSFLTQVLQAGTRTIGVERFFEIEVFPGQFTTIEGTLEINLTGSLGAGLQISRIDLRFQNEAVQIIVPQYHPPEVRVDVTYTGTGLFRAVWEVADPRVTAAGGTPIFRVLRQDRIRLGIGGFKRVKGPNLPADLTGLHVVRFRVLDGELAGQAPVVRYFVKAAAPDGEDWWKRYIRPHTEGEGLVRVPAEPGDDSVVIEDAGEPEDQPPADSPGAGEPTGDGTAGEEPAEDETATDSGTQDASGGDSADGGTSDDGGEPQE